MTSSTQASTHSELAGLGVRFASLAIDGILLGIVEGIMFRSGGGAGGAVGFILGLAYYWYFWTRRDGQTLGKMLLNLRVVKVDGSPISDQDAIIRYVGYIVNSVALMLGWIWALFDDKRQGWHDKFVGTIVVHTERDEKG